MLLLLILLQMKYLAMNFYTQDQQTPSPGKSTKTQGENPRKHRAKKYTPHLKTTGKGNKGPTKSTLTTCELIQLQTV